MNSGHTCVASSLVLNFVEVLFSRVASLIDLSDRSSCADLDQSFLV